MSYEELLLSCQNGLDEEDSHAVYWLFLEYYNFNHSEYLINKNNEVDIESVNNFLSLVEKYTIDKIPVQYIIGHSYFYGRKFIVNSDTLIPRPETEELVYKTINYIKQNFSDINRLNILDLATGSGCIGITLSKELNCKVTISDINKKTLLIAQENVKLNDAKVNVVYSDWFENINDKFDVIISNPPYIPVSYKVDEKVAMEPLIALYSGEDGADSYRQIVENIDSYLSDNAIVAFEHGYDQKELIASIVNNSLKDVKIIQEKDLSERDRFTFIFK